MSASRKISAAKRKELMGGRGRWRSARRINPLITSDKYIMTVRMEEMRNSEYLEPSRQISHSASSGDSASLERRIVLG